MRIALRKGVAAYRINEGVSAVAFETWKVVARGSGEVCRVQLFRAKDGWFYWPAGCKVSTEMGRLLESKRKDA